MGSTNKTNLALALEAMLAACALLGGVRLTWMAMESGLDRWARINSCYLPARWVPASPVEASSKEEIGR